MSLRLAWLRARYGRRFAAARGVQLGRGTRVRLGRGARLALGRDVRLGERCRVHVNGGRVEIGDRSVLGDRCAVYARTGVVVGPDCSFADRVVVMDFSATWEDVERPVRSQPLRAEPVVIGAGARLGPAACVEAGATVAPGAVVAPGVVVAPYPSM